MDIPQMPFSIAILYSAFFVGGSTGMLFINFKWFSALVRKAKEMISRVQNGESPTLDYDRPTAPVPTVASDGKKAQ
jgi:hypothetical protein